MKVKAHVVINEDKSKVQEQNHTTLSKSIPCVFLYSLSWLPQFSGHLPPSPFFFFSLNTGTTKGWWSQRFLDVPDTLRPHNRPLALHSSLWPSIIQPSNQINYFCVYCRNGMEDGVWVSEMYSMCIHVCQIMLKTCPRACHSRMRNFQYPYKHLKMADGWMKQLVSSAAQHLSSGVHGCLCINLPEMPAYHSSAEAQDRVEGCDWSKLLTSLRYANEKWNYLHKLPE